MDHVIESLREHLEPRIEEFIKEWETNKYEKFSECPTYKEVKIIAECINKISREFYEDKWQETPREIIKNKEWIKENIL